MGKDWGVRIGGWDRDWVRGKVGVRVRVKVRVRVRVK